MDSKDQNAIKLLNMIIDAQVIEIKRMAIIIEEQTKKLNDPNRGRDLNLEMLAD